MSWSFNEYRPSPVSGWIGTTLEMNFFKEVLGDLKRSLHKSISSTVICPSGSYLMTSSL